MKKNYNLNIRYAFLIICIYLLVFQNLLQTIIPFFRYFDEMLAAFSILIILINLLKRNKNSNKINNIIMILLMIILLIGLYSNIIYKFQLLKYACYDILLFFKFYLIYFMADKVWNTEFIKRFEKKINNHISFIVIILLIFTILNYIFTIWSNEIRYNILSNKLFYTHATFLAGVCIFLLTFSIRLKKKIFTFNNFIILFILLSTLRFKAVGAALAIVLLSLYVERSDKKISLSKLGLIGVIILFFTFDQINFYFFENSEFARQKLLTTSFNIANDYFPIGTGFATYGSFYSAENYSPVYYMYHLNNVYGLSPSYNQYVSDSFYPMILGQFGYIGLILYLICIFMLFKNIQNIDIKNHKYEYISKLCAFVYLIISSTSESSFTGPMAISLSIIMGINDLKKDDLKEESN